MNKTWVTQQNYDHKRQRVNYNVIKDDPEEYGYKEKDCIKKTVPGQAMTVKEIMTRYEKGRPIPQE